MGNDSFTQYHPVINFSYFASVIVFGMVFVHPVLLLLSFLGSGSYALFLGRKKGLKFMGAILIPLIILSCFINPLINHRGGTILLYFRGNPITLEATVYGLVATFMLSTIILWFYAYNKVMTADKFMYLFGGIVPSVSLIFSMVLRFVPNFYSHMKVLSDTQKCIGRDVSNSGRKKKLHHGVKILSMMTTWALENAVDTADSMNARGYGTHKRVNYSRYSFDGRNGLIGILLVSLIGAVLMGGITGRMTMDYFPFIESAPLSLGQVVAFTAYGILCFLPIIINVREELWWKYLQSKI